MRSRALLLSLALLVGATTNGCALVGDPCEAPVNGTATYVSGSTPPPYHHEWSLRLEESSGTITYSPGYGSAESWSATFAPDVDRVTTACRELRKLADRETAPGGGTLTLRWQGGGGRSLDLTTSDEQAAELVRRAVPAAAWTEAQGAYERWRETQRH